MQDHSHSGLAGRLLSTTCWRRTARATMMAGAMAIGLSGSALAAQDAYAPVSADELNNAGTSDGWLMFNRDYTGGDFAPFTQIDKTNVGKLSVAWTSDKIDIPNGFEGSPIINGDYMFVTTPKDRIIAYNATTGTKLWEYDYPVPANA
jgi:alcohol dehydrogenase (cytochrome c)